MRFMHHAPRLKPACLPACLSLRWCRLYHSVSFGWFYRRSTERSVTPRQFVHCIFNVNHWFVVFFGEFSNQFPPPFIPSGKQSIAFQLERPVLSRGTWWNVALSITLLMTIMVSFQVKVYYGTGFQKCRTILSDVFDFYDFVRRVAEIEAVVLKCTLILYFHLSFHGIEL